MCNLFKLQSTVPKAVFNSAQIFKGKFGQLTRVGPEDEFYFCAPLENVHQWCQDCRSECPPYSHNTLTAQGFDCDDFADCFAAYCKRKNLSNAVWEVWGQGPSGGHAWNVCQCPDGLYEIEPQTGVVWLFGSDPEYRAELIK